MSRQRTNVFLRATRTVTAFATVLLLTSHAAAQPAVEISGGYMRLEPNQEYWDGWFGDAGPFPSVIGGNWSARSAKPAEPRHGAYDPRMSQARSPTLCQLIVPFTIFSAAHVSASLVEKLLNRLPRHCLGSHAGLLVAQRSGE
jgi:hypothetical protein